MALAKKCDRCGKLYEYYPTNTQLNAHNAKKINNVFIFISPFLSNLPVYANINSPGYLNIHDMDHPFRASPHICKTRSIYRNRPLYKYLPLIFAPFFGLYLELW